MKKSLLWSKRSFLTQNYDSLLISATLTKLKFLMYPFFRDTSFKKYLQQPPVNQLPQILSKCDQRVKTRSHKVWVLYSVTSVSKCLEFMTFREGCFVIRNWMQVLKWSSWDFLSPLILQKMKEDSISELDHYDAPFCEQQYTHGSCYIPLFKFKSFDQLIPPNMPQILDMYTVAERVSEWQLIIAVRFKAKSRR